MCVCVEYSGGRTRLVTDDLHTYYVCMFTSGFNQGGAAEAQYKTITRAVSGCHFIPVVSTVHGCYRTYHTLDQLDDSI